MFINPSDPIRDFDGQPIEKETIGGCICNALMATGPRDHDMTGEEKLRRFKLAMRVHGRAIPVSISVEEAALIKRVVGQAYGPMVVGQVWEAIDGPQRDDAAAAAE